MTQQHLMASETLGSPRADGAGGRSWLATFAREMTVQDWLISAYFLTLLSVTLAGSGPTRDESLHILGATLVVLAAGLTLSRGGVLARGGFWSTLVYRLTVFGTVVSSYFQLRLILPAVTSRALDASIFAFDLRVFHYEPALAWDAFVNPQTTEWFAFFYFGYFFVLAGHVLPFLLAVKDTDLLARFALGIFGVFCFGHLIYMLVPGFGPYQYLAGQFHHELTGGTYLRLVREAVEGAGAQKDIFPSLHTAVPTYFALFSFRNRRHLVFRYSWPLVTFIATQIIGATMFLRWHYLIDIFAGLALATSCVFASEAIIAWETRHREREGISPAWAPLSWGALLAKHQVERAR